MIFAFLMVLALAYAQELDSPEVLSADTEPLQIRAVSHQDATLVLSTNLLVDTDASHYKILYGRSTTELRGCTKVQIVGNGEIQCLQIASGVGQQVVVAERLNENGQVEARHRFQWSYSAPIVLSMSGGADGVPLIVGGRNFGPKDAALGAVEEYKVEVFVGPFAAHSAATPCVVLDEQGTQIQCGKMPLGFGEHLRVTVCVAGVCGSSAEQLYSFDAPKVVKTFVVRGRLHLVGSGFGPAVSAEAEHLVKDLSLPALALEIDGRSCENVEVVVPGYEISCDAADHKHPGAAESLVLQRREKRSTLYVIDGAGAGVFVVNAVTPTHGPTTGQFEMTLTGSGFGSKGHSVSVSIGGRHAHGCVVSRDDEEVWCASAPAGAGDDLDVTIEAAMSGLHTQGIAEAAFSYDRPTVSSASRSKTRGGKIFVFGKNFGPSFIKKRVYIVDDDDEERECEVERGTHDRIQCDAPHGTGDDYSIEVKVAGQRSKRNNAFGYKRPDIHSATRPHWRGGHVYIRGRNFGTRDNKLTVYIDGEECRRPEVTQRHREIRCHAPPGRVDGKQHDVKVRVDGQSSDKDGHRYDHLRYSNTDPYFAGHTERFIAVAGNALKIKLPAYDADGDELYYRARGLPEGASWRQGFGFMEIAYDPPASLLEYPHTEVDVTLEVSVTDGPGTATALLDVQARACPATMDACKDQSCANRNSACPRCPVSDVVRCSAARPVLNAYSGSCEAAVEIEAFGHAQVMPRGYTFDVAQETHMPIIGAGNTVVGVLVSLADNSLVAAKGPQPHNAQLTCVEVHECPAPANAVSNSVFIASSGRYGSDGLVLRLPPTVECAQDGYGVCLGVYDKESNSWHCADENLLGGDLLGGRVRADGCYALMQDNCPDRANPTQDDSDYDGVGDMCQGTGQGCTDCHSYDALNVKFLQKYKPTVMEFDADDCAKNQSPDIIVTEVGDKFDARKEDL